MVLIINVALHFCMVSYITYSSSSEFIRISLEKYEKIGLFIGSDFKKTSSQSQLFFPDSTVQDLY